MSKVAILFISDIHYSENKKKSQLQKDDENQYYQKWQNFILDLENNHNMKVKYLVISGDLVEEAKIAEYEQITEFLERFCDRFSIEKKNILIIPGNHDINRAKLADYCDQKRINECEANRLHNIKLNNYVAFYKNFFKLNSYDVDKVILSKIFIEEVNILMLGLNSLEKESHLETDHYGYINVQKLEEEMSDYTGKDGENLFVVSHHSFSITGDKEIATLENASIIKETLGLMGINTYIYGHHHTSESKLEIEGDRGEILRYLEIGTLGKVLKNENGESYNNRFSIAICESGELDLHDYAYTANAWEEVNGKKYIHKLIIGKEGSGKSVQEDLNELPRVGNRKEREEIKEEKAEIIINENSDFLFDYMKLDFNYREGHFHWKDGGKTLGWINIASFLGNIDILNRIKECIIDMFERYMNSVQGVIGYGMEGNIMGSSLAAYWLENEKKYYFYPSVHKSMEHINLEKTLWNDFRECSSILLIFDIMPSRGYLQEIIDSNSKLKKCTEIYVLALFYNENLLKKENPSILQEYKIKRFALAKFDVEICEKDVKSCVICQKDLSKVYLM